MSEYPFAKMPEENSSFSSHYPLFSADLEQRGVELKTPEEYRKEALHERVRHDFMYYPPKGDQKERYEAIRREGEKFAHFLIDTVPASRELSRALSFLDDAVRSANSGIARNE